MREVQGIYTKNYKTLLKEINKDMNKGGIQCSWIVRLKSLRYQFSLN